MDNNLRGGEVWYQKLYNSVLLKIFSARMVYFARSFPRVIINTCTID